VYDTWCVYQDDSDRKTYQRSYAISPEGDVALGEAVEVTVQKVYIPVKEAVLIETDYIPLIERSVRTDGTIPLRLIAPGWGSSGYYPADVLERDGPNVFSSGLKMYWDHPTEAEEAERPEGSLRNLAAELVSSAEWMADGMAGPGLYANATVFEPYKDLVEELAPHIGISIRALGKGKEGTIEGRTGPLVEEICIAKGLDFVTEPGAGGQILQLFESARGVAKTKEKLVNEKEAQELRDVNATLTTELEALRIEVARHREGRILQEAATFVSANLPTDLPDLTRTRLVEVLSAKPVLKDGALDTEAFKTVVTDAAAAELDYIAKVTGSGSGAIVGMGSTAVQGGDGNVQLKEAFKNKYLREGKSEVEAEQLSSYAAQGR